MPLAHLRAAGTSLVLDLLENRLPVVRHWGADLGDLSAEALADVATASRTALDGNAQWMANDLPVLPLASLGWSARPAVAVAREDGSGTSPHLGAVTHEVTAEEGPAGTVQIVRSSGTDEADAITLSTEIRLEPGGLVRVRAAVTDERPHADAATPFGGHGDLLVTELTPYLPVPDAADELLDMAGHHVYERHLVRSAFTSGAHLRESWEGRPGHDAATWLAAGRTGFGFRTGTAHAVHPAWSGNTRFLALNPMQGRRLLGAGEALLPGEIVLGPGESYETPWVSFSWGEGLDAVSHRSHDYLRSLPAHPTTPRPVILNTWEAVYFDHDLDKLKALADRAARVGIERFVLDDGWFGSRRDDTSGLGDWQVSEEMWPQGLEPIASYMRDLGMEFGLWFEPESINVDSELARRHPEWILSDGGEGTPEHRQQRILDLNAPGALDYLLGEISDLVERVGIDYIKWDHNSPAVGISHMVEPRSVRHGRRGASAVHEQTLALYELMDALRERHPGLEIESCAGGGGRIDMGVLEHSQRVWTSDSIDAHDRQDIQRGTVLLIPPEVMGTHVGTARAHTTLRDLDVTFRAGTALWGHMGVEWDLTSADDATLDLLASIIALHKEHRDLLHSGRTVHADTAVDDALRVEGVVATDGSEALYELAAIGQTVAWPASPQPLPGLDPERSYRVELATPAYPELNRPAGWMAEGVTLPGAYLTTVGIGLPGLHPDHLVLVRATAV